jgi:polar amino acid transport system permease protein
LSIGSIVLATLLGVPLGILSSMGRRPIPQVIGAYVYVIRGIPALITIFFIYYALPLWGIHASRLSAGIIALSMYGAAFYAEIVRGGIEAIPRQQREAGIALGMRRWNLVRLVILPQAIRYAIPSYVLMSARMIRTTSIVYIVGVSELTLVARETVARENAPFQVLFCAMFIYFLLSYPLSVLGARLEARLNYVH